MSDRDSIFNALVFQVWLVFTVAGVLITLAYGGPASMIFPWIGAFLGIAINELLPGFVAQGVKIV